MFKVLLNDINIDNIQLDYFSLHLSVKYNLFFICDNKYKIFYRGYIGMSEIHCFFSFVVVLIVDDMCNQSDIMFDITYSYLCDLLISIIFILLENSLHSCCDIKSEFSYII